MAHMEGEDIAGHFLTGTLKVLQALQRGARIEAAVRREEGVERAKARAALGGWRTQQSLDNAQQAAAAIARRQQIAELAWLRRDLRHTSQIRKHEALDWKFHNHRPHAHDHFHPRSEHGELYDL